MIGAGSYEALQPFFGNPPPPPLDRGVGSRPVWERAWSFVQELLPPDGLGAEEAGNSSFPQEDFQTRGGCARWFFALWLNFLMWIADTGFVYCGTLCTSVGYAARWAYWLAMAVVGVVCLQLAVWTVSWVIIPLFRHTHALYRYLTGQGPWHEVVRLHGLTSFRPRWRGPGSANAWSSQDVQQEVRPQ